MKFFPADIDLNKLNYEQFKDVLIEFVDYGATFCGVKDIQQIKDYISSKLTNEEQLKLLSFIRAGKISYDGFFRDIRLMSTTYEHLPEVGFVGIQSALTSLLLSSNGPIQVIFPSALRFGLIGIGGTLAFIGAVNEISNSFAVRRLNEIEQYMLANQIGTDRRSAPQLLV